MDNTWNGTERDTFQLSDTSYTSIGSVEVVARAARITTNDNNNVRLFIRSGSTDSQSPAQTLSVSWSEVSYSWTADPATGQPWTQAAVNALQAGVRNAMSGSGGGGVGVTQVYVVVTEAAQILRPTANGTYTEWGELWGSGTTHWDRVEEVSPDDSASYIFDNTWNGTERDTFQLSDTSYTSIGSVEVVARAKRITTNDNNNLRVFIRSGSTDAQSPVQTLSTTWSEVSYTWTTDPATGQPWTQAAVNALQAGVRNAMGGGGGGGVGVTQLYVVVHDSPPPPPPPWVYPSPSMGVDNDYNHYGASYSRWAGAGAAAGFGFQSPGNNVAQQAVDAASAYQAGVPVYVYFCITPVGQPGETTLAKLNNFVDSLAAANVLNYINSYNRELYVVYDIEDGDTCGPWVYVDLPTAESWITYWSQIIINRARADGLSSSRPVYFSSVPGITTYIDSGTVELTKWITNNFPGQFSSTRTYFPQLFGPHVNPSSWGSRTASILQTFNSVGLAYSQTNPNWEDFWGWSNCDAQSDIDSMKAWYLYLANNQVNKFAWYPYYEPFCVP